MSPPRPPGTYDEDLLLGSRVLLFAMSAEAPSFATMVLAAHYMGLRPAATVLLVQPLDPAAMQPVREANTRRIHSIPRSITQLIS